MRTRGSRWSGSRAGIACIADTEAGPLLPAPEIPAEVLLRALQGISGLQEQIAELERRYRERQDLPGVRLLLRASSMLLESMRAQWIERSRKLRGKAYEGPDQPLQRERAKRGEHQMPLDARLDTVVDGLRRFEALIRVRVELLAEPHGSAFDALSEPFRRLAKSLPGGEEVELIFRPTAATGYEIWFKVMDEVRTFAAIAFGEDLNRAFEQMPRLMAIEYPWHYERDTFLHAVIAHEIGHIAFLKEGLGDRAWLRAAKEEKVPNQKQVAWRKAYVEFGCDLLATRMIGPAYPLALIEHTIGQNVWFSPEAAKTGGSHPPVPTRIRRLRGEVAKFFDGEKPKAESHALALDASRRAAEEWMSKLPEDDGLPEDIEKVMDRALAAIDEKLLGDAALPAELFRQQLGSVWDALTAGIAPAEIVFGRDVAAAPSTADGSRSSWSEPCDWRTILNGCYLRWLHEREGHETVGRMREGAKVIEDRLQRCEHARGAIELSELHRAMLAQQEQLRSMEIAFR